MNGPVPDSTLNAYHAIVESIGNRAEEGLASFWEGELAKVAKAVETGADAHALLQEWPEKLVAPWTEAKANVLMESTVEGYKYADIFIKARAGQLGKAQLELTIDPALWTSSDLLIAERVKAPVGQWAAETSKIETVTSAKLIEKILNRTLNQPGSTTTLSEKAKDLMDGGITNIRSRANMLARTYSNWGANEGALLRYQDAGVTQLEWLATLDDAVRPAHAALHGARITTGATFHKAGDKILVDKAKGTTRELPFDVKHPPLEPNCRCVLVPVIDESFEIAETPKAEELADPIPVKQAEPVVKKTHGFPLLQGMEGVVKNKDGSFTLVREDGLQVSVYWDSPIWRNVHNPTPLVYGSDSMGFNKEQVVQKLLKAPKPVVAPVVSTTPKPITPAPLPKPTTKPVPTPKVEPEPDPVEEKKLANEGYEFNPKRSKQYYVLKDEVSAAVDYINQGPLAFTEVDDVFNSPAYKPDASTIKHAEALAGYFQDPGHKSYMAVEEFVEMNQAGINPGHPLFLKLDKSIEAWRDSVDAEFPDPITSMGLLKLTENSEIANKQTKEGGYLLHVFVNKDTPFLATGKDGELLYAPGSTLKISKVVFDERNGYHKVFANLVNPELKKEVDDEVADAGLPDLSFIKDGVLRSKFEKEIKEMQETLRGDQYKESYIKRFSEHYAGLKKNGFLDTLDGVKLAQSSKWYKYELLDQKGTEFDGMRKDGKARKLLADYLDQHNAVKSLGEYAGAQARHSGNEEVLAAASFFVDSRTAGERDWWWYGQGTSGYYRGRSWLLTQHKDKRRSYEDALIINHAATWGMLKRVDFPYNDRKKGVLGLIRTEERRVLEEAGLKPGKKGVVKGAPLASTSVFDHVVVNAAQPVLTHQEVPYHRVHGSYFFSRDAGYGGGLYAGDNENEFVADLRGIKRSWEVSLYDPSWKAKGNKQTSSAGYAVPKAPPTTAPNKKSMLPGTVVSIGGIKVAGPVAAALKFKVQNLKGLGFSKASAEEKLVKKIKELGYGSSQSIVAELLKGAYG